MPPGRQYDQRDKAHEHQARDGQTTEAAVESVVETGELCPCIIQTVRRARRHNHVAGKASEVVRGRHIELPLGVGGLNIRFRGTQSHRPRQVAAQRGRVLCIDDIDGEGPIAAAPTRKRNQDGIAILLRLDWPPIDRAGPELSPLGQHKALELLVVVLDGIGGLGEQLPLMR